jgi:predicted N-acetyltransferase YhbS
MRTAFPVHRDEPASGPAVRRPRHDVRGAGYAEVLLSYAEVLRVTAARDGEQVQVLGLSNVFTFPPYRNEGHASAIIRAVGEVVNERDAELAILFCERELQPFYAGRGWQVAPAGSIQAPVTAPCTMVSTGPDRAAQLAAWLSAAPVILGSRW